MDSFLTYITEAMKNVIRFIIYALTK